MRLCPSTSTPFCPLLFGTCILVLGWYHHDKSFHSQSRMNSYILSLFERRLNTCPAIRRIQKRLHPGSAQRHRANLLDTWSFFIFYLPEMLACASFLFLFQVWETSFWLSPVQITENSSFSSLFSYSSTVFLILSRNEVLKKCRSCYYYETLVQKRSTITITLAPLFLVILWDTFKFACGMACLNLSVAILTVQE